MRFIYLYPTGVIEFSEQSPNKNEKNRVASGDFRVLRVSDALIENLVDGMWRVVGKRGQAKETPQKGQGKTASPKVTPTADKATSEGSSAKGSDRGLAEKKAPKYPKLSGTFTPDNEPEKV